MTAKVTPSAAVFKTEAWGKQSGYAETDAPDKRAYLNSGVADWFLVALFGPLGRRVEGCLSSLPPGTDHVIDAGAGTGPLIWRGIAMRRLPAQYTAFDPDPHVYSFAKNLLHSLSQTAKLNFHDYALQLKSDVEAGHGIIAKPAKTRLLKQGFALTQQVLEYLAYFKLDSGTKAAGGEAVPFFTVHYKYKDDAKTAPERVITYYNCGLPVADPQEFGISNADALVMLGLTENFEDFREFLELTKNLVLQIEPRFILFTALEEERKGQIPGWIQKVMSQAGAGLFGARAPKLHYHHSVHQRTGEVLNQYAIKLVPQFGARALVQLLRK